MYKTILLAIDLNDETSCRKPLLSTVELARTFGARLHVLTIVREVEAILETKAAPLSYDLIAADLENRIAALIRRADASDLKPNILVTHGATIYAEILAVSEKTAADLIVVGSHRRAMKITCSAPMRRASCATLIARSWWLARKIQWNRKYDARSSPR